MYNTLKKNKESLHIRGSLAFKFCATKMKLHLQLNELENKVCLNTPRV